jgi:hypothetical protein
MAVGVLDELFDRVCFFLLLGFCDQIIFCGPGPIFFRDNKLHIDASASQRLSVFHDYLSF